MNFLAHLHLVRGDRDLMLGALLGDFIRGQRALLSWPADVRFGIRLHRRIDRITDHDPDFRALQKTFQKPFRRYSGIIIDLAFDHQLARSWSQFERISLAQFDREIRDVVNQCDRPLPGALVRFMNYANRRGLFAAYRDDQEVLRSLAGIGRRLKRSNPLHRVGEIWPEIQAPVAQTFEVFYPRLQAAVQSRLKRRSTTTGS
ncbi:MAG: ACP phosphodiesterase [Xanthomonadales bacterium]|nr:ACP phosphodiesterase [Xanthomonadales bacterium]